MCKRVYTSLFLCFYFSPYVFACVSVACCSLLWTCLHLWFASLSRFFLFILLLCCYYYFFFFFFSCIRLRLDFIRCLLVCCCCVFFLFHFIVVYCLCCTKRVAIQHTPWLQNKIITRETKRHRHWNWIKHTHTNNHITHNHITHKHTNFIIVASSNLEQIYILFLVFHTRCLSNFIVISRC